VPTNLAEQVAPYLVDIEGLESDEEKMAVIEKVYEKITADEGIMETIKNIKSHKWVKVAEGSAVLINTKLSGEVNVIERV